jgi:hypothetical protein
MTFWATLGGRGGGGAIGCCGAARPIIWDLASSWLGDDQAGEGMNGSPEWAFQRGGGGNGPWLAACQVEGSWPSSWVTCQALGVIWALEELHGGGGVAELERTQVDGSGKLGSRNESDPSRWMAWAVPARPMGRPKAIDCNTRQAKDFQSAWGRPTQRSVTGRDPEGPWGNCSGRGTEVDFRTTV